VTQRTSFGKLQRDRDKQAKAAAKRDRRRERQTDTGAAEEPGALLADTGSELSPPELLKMVEAVHRQFEEGTIDFDTFDQTKAALLDRLPLD
jgi:hypothetical protein